MATSSPMKTNVVITTPLLRNERRAVRAALKSGDEGTIAYWTAELLVSISRIETNRLDQAKDGIDVPTLRTIAAQILRISEIVDPTIMTTCARCKAEMFSGKDSSGRHLICLTCGIRVETED